MARIIGNDDQQFIDGTAAADVIASQGGDDEINGFLGNDRIWGGDGNDFLNGFGNADNGGVLSPDADQIHGGNGDDFLDGGDGNDRLYGDAGNDSLLDDRGAANFLNGGTGNDYVDGQGRVYGAAGDDIVVGNGRLDGGTGNDYVASHGWIDRPTESIGGAGADTFGVQVTGNDGIAQRLTLADYHASEGDRFAMHGNVLGIGQDNVDQSQWLFAGFDSNADGVVNSSDAYSHSDGHGGLTLSYFEDTVTLQHVAELHAADFVL
jgi:Ca2+-binding RTX toxin-like protein